MSHYLLQCAASFIKNAEILEDEAWTKEDRIALYAERLSF